MPVHDMPAPREVEELAALLDHHTTTGGGPVPGRSALEATVALVHRGDLPVTPSPDFRATLKEHVMHSASASVASPAFVPSPNGHRPHPARAAGPVRPVAVRRPLDVSGRRRGLMEFVSLTALIAVIFAQAMGFGGNLAFWQDAATPPPTLGPSMVAPGGAATPAADGAGDVAMERGNPGRTGVYDTVGPEELPALLWRYSDPNGDDMDVLEPIVAGDEVDFSILRGTAFAVSSFTLPEGEGGFSYWLATSADSVNVGFGHGLIYAASILSLDREHGAMNETPALVAYDQVTYEERWRVEIDFASGSSPVLSGNMLVVLGNDALIALDALTGTELWRTPVAEYSEYGPYEPQVRRNPAVDGDIVVVNEVVATPGDSLEISGTLRAFDLATGAERWSIPGEGVFNGPPAIMDGIVYSYVMPDNGCCAQSRLLAVDAMTGEKVWEVPGKEEGDPMISFDSTTSSPVVDQKHVYTSERVGDANTVTLTARDRLTGEVSWQGELGEVYASQFSVADGVLYYTLSDGGIYAASTADGAELWHVDTGDATLGTPVPGDGYLVIASRTAVYAFGPAADPNDASADVSGLPACTSPRTVSKEPPTGEPALSLVSVEDNPLGYGVPTGGRMLLADVPTGGAADDAAVAGIFATLRAMTACDRPGSVLELAGFYSDDYFRRFSLVPRRPGDAHSVYSDLFPVGTLTVGSLGVPFTLPDGRVALLAFDPLGDRGELLVFIEQDGAWLIDEVVEVGRDPEVWRQG